MNKQIEQIEQIEQSNNQIIDDDFIDDDFIFDDDFVEDTNYDIYGDKINDQINDQINDLSIGNIILDEIEFEFDDNSFPFLITNSIANSDNGSNLSNSSNVFVGTYRSICENNNNNNNYKYQLLYERQQNICIEIKHIDYTIDKLYEKIKLINTQLINHKNLSSSSMTFIYGNKWSINPYILRDGKHKIMNKLLKKIRILEINRNNLYEEYENNRNNLYDEYENNKNMRFFTI